MLGIRPVHVAGLLGRPFVRSLAVAMAPIICLALAIVGLLVRLTAMIGVITATPPAVLVPLAVR